ncbi:MAG: carbohydrate binding domain-containing protein [Prevotellaceae bacterium]|nr:carbohydrate binding domain-containing protein [Candidatus Minthosoma caballi]
MKRNILKQVFAICALSVMPMLANAQVKDYFGAIPDLKVSGKEFVDPEGRPVTLHGVMDTPNDYFNGGRWRNGSQWPLSYSDPNAVTYCKQYFTKVFQAIANPAKGTYCNLFRLHLDPAWTNDPDKTATNGGGENDISRFSADRLRAYLQSLYIPIVKDALGHGLYVIIRPPGVFPEDVTVGDAYNQYLLTVWDIVSSNDYVKSHAGQIMLELGNEPVRMSGNLADYFQPIVNKIRQNGFTGILLLPGTSYQANYTNYNTKPISDNNFGYAVHNYPGWYGGWDANQSEANFISTFEAQVPVDKKPIVITEVDWSPMKEGAGHWNELHTQYTEGNFGTWATATTNSPAPNVAYKNTQNVGWGMRFKHLVDKHPNISWTLQGTTTYVDMDAYLKDGTVKPAFTDAMKAAGYADASEACSKTCFDWYYDYACGDRLPKGTPSVLPEVIPHSTTATIVGNAAFNENNGHYCFYAPSYSSFVFNDFAGTLLVKCADFTVNLGEGSTIGYRLDVQLKDASGNIIKDGDQNYIIGTEAKGTRFTSAESKTFDFQTIFADYLENYPGCTVGEIRLNTVVDWGKEDTDKTGKYWFTIDKMEMNVSEVVARAGVKGTSLADVKMYKHDSTIDYVFNKPNNLGGWGNGAITNNNDGSYNIVISEKKNPWDGQFNIPNSYADGVEYTLKLNVKGSVAGTIGAAIQKSEGYVGCGNFPSIPVTTEWQTVTVKGVVEGEGADRILINYGDYLGTLYFDNIQVYTVGDKTTEITGNNIRLDEDATNGAEVFGAGLIGNVAWNEYADLSAYSKMIIKGNGGSLRVLYNRPAEGTCPELNPTLASGEAVVNLSEYQYFHLNSIKVGWGQTANVSSITLISSDGSDVEIADYYIAGAGHEDPSIAAALADETATVIDITGYTGKTENAFASANPNCLLIYKDGTNVGSAYDARNLVKNDNSAWRIALTDGYDFRSPVNINTVAKSFDSANPYGASYTRDLTTEWATMALPFELDVTYAGSPEIYVLSSVEGEEMSFTRVTEGTVAAGKVIMYRNQSLGSTTLYGSNIAVTADGFNIQPSGVDGWYTAQSFKNQVIEDVTKDPVLKDYDVYGISKDEFVHATKKLTLKPFRAFFLKKKSEGANARFRISIGDEADAIATPNEKNEAATELHRYNSAGVLVTSPVKGINIIRMSDGSVRKEIR